MPLVDPLGDQRWDSFVAQHPYGWITHLSGWKRVLENSFPHIRGYYLTLEDEATGTIKAGLPLYLVKSWLTGRRLVSIPFATLCDPLVSSEEQMKRLFAETVTMLEQLGVGRLEIRTLSAASLLTEFPLGADSTNKHHMIRLCSDPEQVRSRFHRSCVRQRINRAEGSGIRVVKGSTEADLRAFYRLHRITRRRRHLPPQPYRFIRSIWETFSAPGMVQLFLAYKDQTAVAGIIVFSYKDRVSIEFSALDEAYKQFSPLHLLFWRAIKDSCLAGFEVLDFGRTSALNKSLMEFKSHWGAEVTDLPEFYYPLGARIDRFLSDDSMKRKLLGIVCAIAPDFALNIIGDFCYRHLG